MSLSLRFLFHVGHLGVPADDVCKIRQVELAAQAQACASMFAMCSSIVCMGGGGGEGGELFLSNMMIEGHFYCGLHDLNGSTNQRWEDLAPRKLLVTKTKGEVKVWEWWRLKPLAVVFHFVHGSLDYN